jgi:hypothetical protein
MRSYHGSENVVRIGIRGGSSALASERGKMIVRA